MRPGTKDPSYDYIELPFDPDWEPVNDRKWALKYIGEDGGTEDYEGFVKELRERIPGIFGTVEAWLPPSVNEFVRYDSSGKRLDIDWELAAIPLTDEEKKAMADTNIAKKREARIAALEARGQEIPEVLQASRPKRRGRPPGLSHAEKNKLAEKAAEDTEEGEAS
jgi:hypothetical protein